VAGRPPLRIGQHGKITRTYLGSGVWLARCKFRDADGVTRRLERRGPADEYDKHGKLAEDALIEALATRREPSGVDEIGLDTKITVLVEQHLARLADDGRSPVTLSTYRFTTTKLTKFIGGVRVGEATPARIDAAIRSMRTAHGPTMARQSKTLLRGALQLAVMANALGGQPGTRSSADRVEASTEGRDGAHRRPVAQAAGEVAGRRLLPAKRSR
jgi:hypothetical protein